MQIEIIEPKKEHKVMTADELDFHQPQAGEIVELTYLTHSREPKEITGVFMVVSQIWSTACLVDLNTGIAEKTTRVNPLSNVRLAITKVRYFESGKLVLKREKN